MKIEVNMYIKSLGPVSETDEVSGSAPIMITRYFHIIYFFFIIFHLELPKQLPTFRVLVATQHISL